jgi:hypothetical protein
VDSINTWDGWGRQRRNVTQTPRPRPVRTAPANIQNPGGWNNSYSIVASIQERRGKWSTWPVGQKLYSLNGPSIPGRNGLRHRFLNRYCETETKNSRSSSPTKEPLPKAFFKYWVKVPPGTKAFLLKITLNLGRGPHPHTSQVTRFFHAKYACMRWSGFEPWPLASRVWHPGLTRMNLSPLVIQVWVAWHALEVVPPY